MIDGGDDEEEPLILRWTDGPSLHVPAHLDVAGMDQIVEGSIRPDLERTVISKQWASALELSPGADALVQLVTEHGEAGIAWGPCKRVTPTISPELDERITDRGVGGFLLGNDFLDGIWITTVSGLAILHRAAA